MTLHLFGIRHHGPSSARSLLSALEKLQPDIILVEGPPDADGVIHWLGHEDMEPPVALLVYHPKALGETSIYPFTIFSPELQAIRFGLSQDIPVRFMDLPLSIRKNIEIESDAQGAGRPDSAEAMRALAKAADFPDFEQWWNQLIEQRGDDSEIFDAIFDLMVALRAETDQPLNPLNTRQRIEFMREAYMRKIIRKAERDGYEKIAVVCGALHTPALATMPPVSEDNALLKGVKQTKMKATWAPWSYSRVSTFTGYGAGIQSPGWYHHLWETHGQSVSDVGIRWLTKVAGLLREEGFDASSAHVIEGVRLAESLAAMRNRPIPSLEEFSEAVQTIFTAGQPEPLDLIKRDLIISERMGAIPPDTPMLPIQRDLAAEQKRLRLRPEPKISRLNLDLRTPMHLERSHLLHRLGLLKIGWGVLQKQKDKKGTYNEVWRLKWEPEFIIKLIDAGMFGNTVKDAASSFAVDQSAHATNVSDIIELLDHVILADLPYVVNKLLDRLNDLAALDTDIGRLMDALPPLVRVLRYGNVRKTDTQLVKKIVDTLIIRITIGLPATVRSLDGEAAQAMHDRLISVNAVTNTLEDEAHRKAWVTMLQVLADQVGLHGLLAGRAIRLLLDGGEIEGETAVIYFQRALSPSITDKTKLDELQRMGAWVEGFLVGSGLLLVHDDRLWSVLDGWLNNVGEEDFITLLPILRRTFSSFSKAERRRIDARIAGRTTRKKTTNPTDAPRHDADRAVHVLPTIARLLGVGEGQRPEG